MRHVVDQLTDPRDHLALDESLLMTAEAGEAGESLRIWEMSQHVVVAGRSTRVDEEIDAGYCRDRGIEILRRCSGGAAVVGGPGCLMYSVVLHVDKPGCLRRIDVAHQYVMGRVLKALRCQLDEAEFQGTCDLTWRNRKCSGNSLRVARDHLLYHGTLLYDFDLPLIGRCLKVAPRQPDYRRGRDHHDFVTNVAIDVARFATDLCRAFEVVDRADAVSFASRMAELRRQRYDDHRWHFRH
jgi:lipoate-protein ligase A